jgi:hypothetical protein
MIDVKKFVVVFLILAAVAGSSALVLLNWGSSSNVSVPGTVGASVASGGTSSVALGNAFTSPTGQGNYDASNNFSDGDSSSTASSSDENNLTNQLADSILTNLFAANPNGPQTTSDGQQVVAEPDPQTVVDGLATSTLADVQIPDWDYEAETVTLNIATSSSASATNAYYNALNNIWENDFISTNLQNVVTEASPTMQDLSLAGSQIEDAIMQIGGLSVPSNLADFQKSLIKLLVYEKNTIELGENSSADPMKTALILQAEQTKYDNAEQSFEDALQAALQTNEPAPGGALSFVNSLLGIQEAHAQFGGIVFDPSVFGRMVWEFVQGILLQILKNTLVTQLQNRALKFISNNGNPRYVTGWAGLLSNSFNTAAGFALGQIEPGLCTGFSASVSGWLQNIYPAAAAVTGGVTLNGAGATNCTLQNAIGSTANFYTDFNNGGWAGFGALLSPQNNPFGAFAIAYDELQTVGNTAQTASQNKAVAGQGYQGISVCDNGQDASQPQMVCTVGVLEGNQCIQPNGTAVVGTPVMIPAGCSDGSEPITTFPGVNAADTLNKNLSSDIDLIVNANDITGLLATVTDALLQQVITNGVNALVGTNAPGSAAAAIPPSGGTTTTPPAQFPIACNPSQSTATVASPWSFGVTGGDGLTYTWTAAGGAPATGNGPAFSTTFNFPGTYVVTVSGNVNGVPQTSTCQVQAK